MSFSYKRFGIILNLYTPMFIAALFTIARTWKQSRYPLADEWIIKLCYIYIYIYIYMYIHTHTHTQWIITQQLKRAHLNQY